MCSYVSNTCSTIVKNSNHKELTQLDMYFICICVFFESHAFVALCPVALIFEGSVNPAHPKHIGSIDPSCDVVEVVKGNE